jgi:hypothetical protein
MQKRDSLLAAWTKAATEATIAHARFIASGKSKSPEDATKTWEARYRAVMESIEFSPQVRNIVNLQRESEDYRRRTSYLLRVGLGGDTISYVHCVGVTSRR